ncbi:putative methyltransferase-domain-containing protein, partial [Russula vinacea]
MCGSPVVRSNSREELPLEDGDVEFSLGHFFRAASDDCDLLLPAPAPSIRDEIIRIDFETQTHQTIALSLSVDAGPGCGGIAWQAGEVLASYISRRGSTLEGLNVLELGSGTGLVGLVAGYLGARVCITDQAPLIPIMKRNILLNGLQSHVTAIELDWAKPIPELPQPPDIVLAADCIYLEATFPLLVSTLVALVPTPPGRAPEVLLSYKKRRKADKRFFALLKTHFTWSSVVRDFDNQEKEKEKKEL